MTARVPPQNNEAEMCAIGCMVLSERAAFEIRAVLSVADFYVPAHKAVYASVCRLMDSHTAIDLVTLRDDMRTKDTLAEAGGVDYLLQIVESVPSAQNALHYAGIVKDKADMRRAFTALSKAEDALMEPDGAAADVIAKALGVVNTGMSTASTESWMDIGRVSAKIPPGVSTGFDRLDSGITDVFGWPCGQWSCVMAKTGAGKTPFLTQQALNATRAGKRVVYALFADLTPALWKSRLVRMVAGHGRPRTTLEEESWSKALSEIDDAFSDNRITVFDGAGETVEAFVAGLQAFHSRTPVDLVCVDYLQRVETAVNFREDMNAKMAHITKVLSRTARAMPKTAGLMGSQMNRAGGAHYGRAFEDDAAVLIELQQQEDDQAKYTWVVEKNRFGPKAKLSGIRMHQGRIAFVDGF